MLILLFLNNKFFFENFFKKKLKVAKETVLKVNKIRNKIQNIKVKSQIFV